MPTIGRYQIKRNYNAVFREVADAMILKQTLTVILLRHGETEGNVKGIVQGQWDTPLTERGMASILRKAEKIRHLSFDAVFCSDLPRTMETLALLSGRILSFPEAVYTRELREIDFGDLTGQLKKDIMPIILKNKANPDLCYPNGESGGRFVARVKGFFEMLMERYAERQILVVTHFGVMETAARQFSGPPAYENITIGADDVWRMIFSQGFSMEMEVL